MAPGLSACATYSQMSWSVVPVAQRMDGMLWAEAQAAKRVQKTDFTSQKPRSGRKQLVIRIVFIRLLKEAF